MMLHRHFETERTENMTTLADVTPVNEHGNAVPSNEVHEEAPKRKGRSKKTSD